MDLPAAPGKRQTIALIAVLPVFETPGN